MTEDQQDPADRRRKQWRAASARRRAKRKAEGLPPESGPSGPSGPSGGTATNAERQRRLRERRKKERQTEE